MIVAVLSLDIVIVTVEENFNNIIINKPKLCNSVSLLNYDDYLTFEEILQQQYKYPCFQTL